MKQLAIALLLSVVLIAGCVGQYGAPTAPAAATGELTIKVTDAAVNVTSLNLVLAGIDVHTAETGATEMPVGIINAGQGINDTSTAGWTTIVSSSTVNLIDVKDILSVLGEAQLAPGLYTQLRLRVSSADVTINGETKTLDVPSNAIRFIHPFRVVENASTSLITDFEADASIVKAGDKYIFKPIVKITTEFSGLDNAEAEQRKQSQATDAARIRNNRAVNGTRGRIIDVPTEGPVITTQPPAAGGTVKNFDLTILHTGYSPSSFTVNKGDTVRFRALTGPGTESHKHGITIDEFSVNEDALSATAPKIIEFVADKAGTFSIYCKTCREGVFGSGHPDIRATLIVNE